MTPAAVTSISRADIPLAVLREIPIGELSQGGSNPRRDWESALLDDLTASIREHGIQSPLLVRSRHDHAPGCYDKEIKALLVCLRPEGYEIVAGHRRWRAALSLGIKTLPCIVRDLSDDEAAEIALIDNLQRVDIPPMDEAEAFGELLDRLLSIEAVAAKVGKEIAYVAKALKLRSLSEPSRLALSEKLITIDHARLLCRLAETEQNAALKWCLDPHAGVKIAVDDVIAKILESRKPDPEEDDDEKDEDGRRRPSWRHTWEPETVQALKDHIEGESGTPLDRAPWRMDEASLVPDVPACVDCEKNTKANAPLFGDLDTGVAVCTDGGCFKAKTEAFVQIALKMAATSSPKSSNPAASNPAAPVRLSWKLTSTAPRMEKDGSGPSLKQVFKYGQWMDVGPKVEKCEHTRPGVTVDWDEPGHSNGKLRKPGEVIQVCIQPKCKTHKKAYEKQAGERESYEQRHAREKKELEAFRPRELRVRRALYDAIAAKIVGQDALKRLLLEDSKYRSICMAAGFFEDDWRKCAKHVEGLVAKAKGVELDWLLLAHVLGGQLHVSHNDIAARDHGRGDLRKVAKELGFDPAAIERNVEESLAAEKARGENPAAKPVPVKKAAKSAAKKAPAPKPAKKAIRKKPSAKKAAKKGAAR